MMKKALVFLLVTLSSHAMAQGNLVPNSSFEYDTACPSSGGHIIFAPPWIDFNSADLYDSCSSPSTFGVPESNGAWQYAHTGSAYSGLVTFRYTSTLQENTREFLRVQLLDTLESGQRYCISFYACFSEWARYSTPNIGVYFSDSLIIPATWLGFKFQINYVPQFENPVTNLINDTMNWVLVSGEYVASGGEQFITIGNFKNDSSTTFQDHFQPGSYGYVFIDDVSLVEKLEVSAGNNATICSGDSVQIGAPPISGVSYTWSPSVGISDTTAAQPWVRPASTTTYQLSVQDTDGLYCLGTIQPVTVTVEDCPLPEMIIPTYMEGDDIFKIQYLPAGSDLELYDMRGRLVLKDSNYNNDFSVVSLAAGIYSYRLQLPTGKLLSGKICIGKRQP